MVVKEKRGRRRYILFEIDPNFTKDSLVSALRKSYPEDAPYVIQVTEKFAVIRCSPVNRDDTIEKMSKIDPKCHSITTSGTLATIREKFPVLNDTRTRI